MLACQRRLELQGPCIRAPVLPDQHFCRCPAGQQAGGRTTCRHPAVEGVPGAPAEGVQRGGHVLLRAGLGPAGEASRCAHGVLHEGEGVPAGRDIEAVGPAGAQHVDVSRLHAQEEGIPALRPAGPAPRSALSRQGRAGPPPEDWWPGYTVAACAGGCWHRLLVPLKKKPLQQAQQRAQPCSTSVQFQMGTPGSGSSARKRPRHLTLAEPDKAPSDVMAFLQTRGEAEHALRAKCDEAGMLLAQERAERRTLEKELAALQVRLEWPQKLHSGCPPGRQAATGCQELCGQAEQARQQELRETLQEQQLALRVEHDAAIAREIGRTSSLYGQLRKAERDLVWLGAQLRAAASSCWHQTQPRSCRRAHRTRPEAPQQRWPHNRPPPQGCRRSCRQPTAMHGWCSRRRRRRQPSSVCRLRCRSSGRPAPASPPRTGAHALGTAPWLHGVMMHQLLCRHLEQAAEDAHAQAAAASASARALEAQLAAAEAAVVREPVAAASDAVVLAGVRETVAQLEQQLQAVRAAGTSRHASWRSHAKTPRSSSGCSEVTHQLWRLPQ